MCLSQCCSIAPLHQDPPSFLLPGQLIEIELAKQVKLHAVNPEEESIGSLVDTTPPVEPPPTNDNVFDKEFGTSGFSEGFDFPAGPPKKDERFGTADVSLVLLMMHFDLDICRDALIEQLMREIVELKDKIHELEGQRNADRELMAGLRLRLEQMDTELNDYREIAEQTCNVSHQLFISFNFSLCVLSLQENVLLKKQIEESSETGTQSQAAEGMLAI